METAAEGPSYEGRAPGLQTKREIMTMKNPYRSPLGHPETTGLGGDGEGGGGEGKFCSILHRRKWADILLGKTP
jgi:hypothetical protein